MSAVPAHVARAVATVRSEIPDAPIDDQLDALHGMLPAGELEAHEEAVRRLLAA